MTVLTEAAIPYIDLGAQHRPLKDELMEAIGRVIDHGVFILGEEVTRFEEAFASLCGARYAVGVNSGTDALIFALRAVGVGPGDEVITVPNSFVASTTCIRLLGARAVFVDVDDDYNIDPSQIESAITPATKAIIPVHLTGRPADMTAVMAIAEKHGLHVIEDAAQSVAAMHAGRPVGSFGDVGCFSLHPLKTLNACGDGGVMTTNDPAIHENLRIMRNIGLKTRDDCVIWSPNSRLDTVQAAVLLVKLRYLQEWTERRRANAALYRECLAGIPQIHIPTDRPGDRAVYHTFVIQAERRDALRQSLESQGIGTAIHYPVPIHLSTAGRELGYIQGDFPVTERQAARIVSLPVYPEMGEASIRRVSDSVRGFYNA
jgi:dTDP-4-amino-4,6-dideoxygalactose transaminase